MLFSTVRCRWSLALVVALVLATVWPVVTFAQEPPPPQPPTYDLLVARLTGAAEVPGPGDPDGFGFTIVAIVSQQQTICATGLLGSIGQQTGVHIHQGAAGEAGPVVVDLSQQTCIGNVAPALIQAISANPAGYYVNVHTAEFPNGAVRGQLSAVP